MGHSDGLMVRAHCRRWWLPFLWGFDPGEHWDLLEMCRKWIEAADSYNWEKTRELEASLQSRRWGWCNGETIWTHLDRAMSDSGLSRTPSDIVLAFNRLAHRLEAARMCDHEERELIFLQPNYAVSQIVLLRQ